MNRWFRAVSVFGDKSVPVSVLHTTLIITTQFAGTLVVQTRLSLFKAMAAGVKAVCVMKGDSAVTGTITFTQQVKTCPKCVCFTTSCFLTVTLCQ